MFTFSKSGTEMYIAIAVRINPLGAAIEKRNLTACATLVINYVYTDANDPSAFLGAHRCFTAHEGRRPFASLKVFSNYFRQN